MNDQAQTAPQGVDLAQAYLDMIAQLKEAKAENARLKAGQGHKLSVKVGEKGAISVYGLGRFPLTLYKSQWIKFWEQADSLRTQVEAQYPNASDKA